MVLESSYLVDENRPSWQRANRCQQIVNWLLLLSFDSWQSFTEISVVSVKYPADSRIDRWSFETADEMSGSWRSQNSLSSLYWVISHLQLFKNWPYSILRILCLMVILQIILTMMHSLKIIMVRHSVNSCNMSMVDEEARWERLMAGNLNCRNAKHALDADLLHFRNPLHFISPRLHLRSQQFLTFWTSLWWLTTGTMISHKAFEAVAINHGTSMIYHIACLSISEYSLDPGWRTTARRNTKGLHSTDLRPRSFKQLLSNRLWDQPLQGQQNVFSAQDSLPVLLSTESTNLDSKRQNYGHNHEDIPTYFGSDSSNI